MTDIPTSQPPTSQPPTGPPAPTAATAPAIPAAAPSTMSPVPPATSVPRTPNRAGIVVGLFCLVVAALVVAKEQLDWQIDWEQYGPAGLIGTGVLLVLLGSLGLARRTR